MMRKELYDITSDDDNIYKLHSKKNCRRRMTFNQCRNKNVSYPNYPTSLCFSFVSFYGISAIVDYKIRFIDIH